MALPKPETGLVIRYAYLWHNEAESGLEEGSKDRPCAIVLAHHRKENGETVVVVAPITHTEPDNDPNAIEIPQAVKIRLGLDEERSWIITNDVNSFTWPGPDLRPVDKKNPGKGIAYGFLPAGLSREVLKRIKINMRTGRVNPVHRTE